MDLHTFVEQFSQTWDWTWPVELGAGESFPQLLHGLSLAVACLEPEEVYCEVGSGQLESLVAALANQPERMGYAIADLAAMPQSAARFELFVEQLAIAGVQEQVWACPQSVTEFFADLQAAEMTDKIGIYVDRNSWDYRTQLLSLLLVQPFLAEQALLVITGEQLFARQQAIQDFLRLHPQAHLVGELTDLVVGYGAIIISWGDSIQLPLPPQERPGLAPEYYGQLNHDLLMMIPPNAQRVVEVGCGAGVLGQRYKQINPGGYYVGVELDPAAAHLARSRLDRVVVGNVEQLQGADLGIEPETVDCLVYGDVLEHLVDPWTVLQSQVNLLRDGGQVVACIPNIQHWSSLTDLLRGLWEYQDSGLLDRTHLRFFTLNSVIGLFESCGLQVINVTGRPVGSPSSEAQLLQILESTAATLGVEAAHAHLQLNSFQYLVRATKSLVPPRKLLIHTRLTPGICQTARILDPDMYSVTIPGTRTLHTWDNIHPQVDDPEEAKVFIWQRPCLDYHLDETDWQTAQQALLAAGYLVLVEIDDNPFGWPEVAQKNFFRLLQTCHGVQVSTEFLSNQIRPLHPNVVVFPNQVATLPPLRSVHSDGPVRLFLGTCNRTEESLALVPILNPLLAEYGDRLQVAVIHEREFFDALETPHKQFEPWCPYPRYLEILRTCQIGLMPLNPTNFNRAKSDLKFLECAAHGVVALASPTVYADSITSGETGLIFHSPEEFGVQLRQLIENPTWRDRLATQAYQWVKQHRLLAQHYHQRRDWYLQMVDQLASLQPGQRISISTIDKER